MLAFEENKLAKARKTRKSPSTLGLKSFGRVSFGSKKVWAKRKIKKKKLRRPLDFDARRPK